MSSPIVLPSHCYVYGWKHRNQKLPFYIGQGQRNRAWTRHTIGPELAQCQLYYDKENTEIIIYRDGLTKEGARLVEAVLIRIFTDLGAVLLNIGGPLKRQEKLPLMVEEMISNADKQELVKLEQGITNKIDVQRKIALTEVRRYAAQYNSTSG